MSQHEFNKRLKRTFAEHRAAIGREREINGGAQRCFDELADAITDLNAAVAKLLEAAELKGRHE